MSARILVTLCDSGDDMGTEATEEDAAAWIAYATERLVSAYPDADITVETSPSAGTRVRADDDQGVRDLLEMAWTDWCAYEWDARCPAAGEV